MHESRYYDLLLNIYQAWHSDRDGAPHDICMYTQKGVAWAPLSFFALHQKAMPSSRSHATSKGMTPAMWVMTLLGRFTS